MSAQAICDILFDLDGTLVDSAPSILFALQDAFIHCCVEPVCAIDSSLIGPPLQDIVRVLYGGDNIVLQESIETSFMQCYDSRYCIKINPFDGVVDMLQKLMQKYRLHVVTNKRFIPTMRIIRHLGWEEYFVSVHSPDSFSSTLHSKQIMIAAIMSSWSMNTKSCVYVGDTGADVEAAMANNIGCLLVKHGYGESTCQNVLYDVNGLMQYFFPHTD